MTTEHFFHTTIETLKSNQSDPSFIYQTIMTPIAPYYMCDYHMCTEPIEWNMPKSTSKELRECVQTIEPYSILFVQNNLFHEFV
jgi:hypothetical protein